MDRTLEPPQYGELCRWRLADGRLLAVVPPTYGGARLHIGPYDACAWDDGW